MIFVHEGRVVLRSSVDEEHHCFVFDTPNSDSFPKRHNIKKFQNFFAKRGFEPNRGSMRCLAIPCRWGSVCQQPDNLGIHSNRRSNDGLGDLCARRGYRGSQKVCAVCSLGRNSKIFPNASHQDHTLPENVFAKSLIKTDQRSPDVVSHFRDELLSRRLLRLVKGGRVSISRLCDLCQECLFRCDASTRRGIEGKRHHFGLGEFSFCKAGIIPPDQSRTTAPIGEACFLLRIIGGKRTIRRRLPVPLRRDAISEQIPSPLPVGFP